MYCQLKFPKTIFWKTKGLLPMLYTPEELGKALSIEARIVRDWIKRGAPHTRDERQHLFVNGEELARWLKEQKSANAKFGRKLAEDEAYCLRDHRAVKMQNPFVKSKTGRQMLIQGNCPICGGIVNRGRRNNG